MDRRQGLQHAVLGILFRADDGLHGWALKQECEIAFGCVWEINVGRIYRALHKLAAVGLVERIDVEGPDRPGRGRPRRVFRISMRGREEMARFVRDAREDTQWERRYEFSVRLLFSGQVFMSDRVRLVEWERQCCERRLRAVARRRRTLRPETRDAALVNLLIDGAETEIRGRMAWLDRIALKLQSGAIGNPQGLTRKPAVQRCSTERSSYDAISSRTAPALSASD